MNKTLRKAMMPRSQLETKFYKTKNFNDERNYKKQINFVSRLYKKNFKSFYRTLNIKNVLGNKNVWKNIKPLFSDKSPNDKTITIVHENEVYSDEKEVSELLNQFFKDAVTNLQITENRFLLNNIDSLM